MDNIVYEILLIFASTYSLKIVQEHEGDNRLLSSLKECTSLRCNEYVLADPWEHRQIIHELPAFVKDENPSQFPVLQEENQKAKARGDQVEDRI